MKLSVVLVTFLIVISCSRVENSPQAFNGLNYISGPQAQNVEASVETGKCPTDMVEVQGNFCPALEEICTKWLDDLRCANFKKPNVCKSEHQVPMHFCMDRYEYPNRAGVKPKLQNTWYQARDQCATEGKRLCHENEWTQACRGPENLPYPYGYTRDASACRIDLPWQDPTTHTFEELDKTVPSGSMPQCVSPYGVYDMTGNADEWTIRDMPAPYQSILKGGHPHGVRNRCTPRTIAHNEVFSYYVTGFRCCKDIQ